MSGIPGDWELMFYSIRFFRDIFECFDFKEKNTSKKVEIKRISKQKVFVIRGKFAIFE